MTNVVLPGEEASLPAISNTPEQLLLNEIAWFIRALHVAGYSRHGRLFAAPNGRGVRCQCWTLKWFREACRDEPEREARLSDLPESGHVLQLVTDDAQHTLEIGYSMKGTKLDGIRVISVRRGDEDGALMWWLIWAIEVRKSFSEHPHEADNNMTPTV